MELPIHMAHSVVLRDEAFKWYMCGLEVSRTLFHFSLILPDSKGKSLLNLDIIHHVCICQNKLDLEVRSFQMGYLLFKAFIILEIKHTIG